MKVISDQSNQKVSGQVSMRLFFCSLGCDSLVIRSPATMTKRLLELE
jgi:hypothetical protein